MSLFMHANIFKLIAYDIIFTLRKSMLVYALKMSVLRSSNSMQPVYFPDF